MQRGRARPGSASFLEYGVDILNVKDMKSFLVVVDRKSISAAAEELFVSPQALSKTIKRMEKELGVELLQRSQHGVEPTVYGQMFYDRAEKLVAGYSDMTREIGDLLLQNRGMLRMASAFGILRYLTPEFVHSFMDRNPNIQLDYLEYPDKYIAENVKDGEADVGLTPYLGQDPELEYTDLFSCDIYFVTHEGSQFYDAPEVSVREINREPLIVENENFVIHHILTDTCEREGVRPDIYFNTSGFSLCYKLCHEGEGNTISMKFIYEDMKSDNIRRIPFKEHPMWNVAAIRRKDIPASDPVKRLIRHAKEWCQTL